MRCDSVCDDFCTGWLFYVGRVSESGDVLVWVCDLLVGIGVVADESVWREVWGECRLPLVGSRVQDMALDAFSSINGFDVLD